MQITTQSREETQLFGKKFGRMLKHGDIVLLFGELGSGKTTLTQGILLGLGLNKDEYVRSPTFTLINEYEGSLPIYHIDLYRLETFGEVESLGLDEIFYGPGVAIIEWAERLYPSGKTNSPIGFGIRERIEIQITFRGENERQFEIQSPHTPGREFPHSPLQ